MLQRLLCAATTLAVLGIVSIMHANAADARIPSKYQATYPVQTWAGFYVGGNLGYLDAVTVTDPSQPADPMRPRGMSIGGQLGHNWQVAPWLVVGLEGGGFYSFASNTVTTSDPFFSLTQKTETPIQLYGIGRVGVLVVPDVLAYVGVGANAVQAVYTEQFVIPGFFDMSTKITRWGLGTVAVVGIEKRFGRWSVDGRYSFSRALFNQNESSCVGCSTFTNRDWLDTHKVQVAVNYQFGH